MKIQSCLCRATLTLGISLLIPFLIAGCSRTGTINISTRSADPGENHGHQVAHNISRSPIRLTSIDMISQLVGWATGQNAIYYTTDAGHQWRNISPRGFHPISIACSDFVDATHAYMDFKESPGSVNSASMAGYDGGIDQLYATSNGGETWRKLRLPPDCSPIRLQFRNNRTGWITNMLGASAGSSRETVDYTSDGGQTWQVVVQTAPSDVKLQLGGLPFQGDKTGTTFLNTATGWATGYTAMNGSVYLYQTKDGGQIWTAQAVPIPFISSVQAQGATFTTYPPIFFTHSHTQSGLDGILPVTISILEASSSNASGTSGGGSATTLENETIFFTTKNSGHTWSPTTSIPIDAAIGPLYATNTWSFPTSQSWYATDGTHLFKTNNGGFSWIDINPGTMFKNILDIDFTSPNDGFAITTSGLLLHSIDSGRTWSFQR